MALYDKEAATYDDWFKTPQGKFMDKLESELVIEMLKPLPGTRILDVGCGTGNMSVQLAKLGCTVIGIDVSENMLLKAHQKGKDLPVHFEKMNASNLNFLTDYFDAVVSVTAFEFIKYPEAAFCEMLRVVKPNGSIVVGTLNKNSKWGELYSSVEFRKKTIFRRACLRSKNDLENYCPEKLVDLKECLHIPPGAEPTDFNDSNEQKLAKTNPGGFLCALWKK